MLSTDVLITCEQILSAPTPLPRGKKIRNAALTEIAAEVRGLLKDLGIKGVSVKAPRYSMAQAIEVRVAEHACGHADWEERRVCVGCQHRNQAIARLDALILAGYPDMDNRSDSNSDYFDYRYSVR